MSTLLEFHYFCFLFFHTCVFLLGFFTFFLSSAQCSSTVCSACVEERRGNLSLNVIQLCCWNALVSNTCRIILSPAFFVDTKKLLDPKDI